MTTDDLHILLQEGEGTTLEFKESFSPSFTRELVALANTIGGKIILGVRDDGVVTGVQDSNSLRSRIQDVARNCDPPVTVHLERVGKVFAVHVRESNGKPVQCSEGFFWRQGSVTQKMSRDEIRDFFRFEGAIRFDLSPCPKFVYPEDFDREKYDAWLSLSGISGRPPVEDVLVNIEVAERANGKLLFRNAGVLFFAKNVRRFFPEAYITCLLARGAEKVHILDRKDFDGGIVADIEDALRFVERNTRTAYRIEGLQRQDIREYPSRAIREAITNAVMHRDWFFDGANVFVELYSDRIEVVSPGGLPRGLSVGNLGSRSIRRNALIADLLHRIGFIEKAGTGILRIQEETREQGCPDPEFEANDFVTVTFRPNPDVRARSGTGRTADDGIATDQVTGQVTDQVTDQVRELVATLTYEMDRAQLQAALQLAHRSHFMTAYIRPALEAGLVEMTIPDKPNSRNQRYRLTRKGWELLAHDGGGDGAATDQVVNQATDQVTGQVTDQVTDQVGQVLAALTCEMDRAQLQAALQLAHRSHFMTAYIRPALEAGLVEMTIPDKPNSRNQRYRLTSEGRKLVRSMQEPRSV